MPFGFFKKTNASLTDRDWTPSPSFDGFKTSRSADSRPAPRSRVIDLRAQGQRPQPSSSPAAPTQEIQSRTPSFHQLDPEFQQLRPSYPFRESTAEERPSLPERYRPAKKSGWSADAKASSSSSPLYQEYHQAIHAIKNQAFRPKPPKAAPPRPHSRRPQLTDFQRELLAEQSKSSSRSDASLAERLKATPVQDNSTQDSPRLVAPPEPLPTEKEAIAALKASFAKPHRPATQISPHAKKSFLAIQEEAHQRAKEEAVLAAQEAAREQERAAWQARQEVEARKAAMAQKEAQQAQRAAALAASRAEQQVPTAPIAEDFFELKPTPSPTAPPKTITPEDVKAAKDRLESLIGPKIDPENFFKDYQKRLESTETGRAKASATIVKRINQLSQDLSKPAPAPKPVPAKPAARSSQTRRPPDFSLAKSLRRLKASLARQKASLAAILSEAFNPRLKKALAYSLAATTVLIALPVSLVALKGLQEKNTIEKLGTAAYGNLKEAQASMEAADIDKAGKNFELAYSNFQEARQKLDEVGGTTTQILDFVPGISKVESGRQLALAGENLALAGQEMTSALAFMMTSKEDLKGSFQFKAEADNEAAAETGQEASLTDVVLELEAHLKQAGEYLRVAQTAAQKINPDDLPSEEKNKIIALRDALPPVNEALNEFLKYSDVFMEILGANGSRKYLILFQNNHEMRATGGFIGTYGVIKMSNGQIEDLLVDGIYNPDGQLKEKIIPPKPIQKMSATWSMHDANWWPDFPTSAEKISWFYEKTGGPTVDGVITLTPRVIQELLEITGPITVSGYGANDELTVSAGNFMETVQYQVEEAYDKTENRPKKVLADLTPLLIKEVLDAGPTQWPGILNALSSALKERHLFLYSFDYDLEKLISDMGWSGEILNTNKDYLSVVNTNISGLKTDGVIKQEIKHQAEIQEDGSIIVTLTIDRRHEGGDSKFEWHNAVNADWMRVYVPQDSQLIAASGFTREFVDPPLDYEKLNFKEDFQVKQMEDSYELDEASATRIYQEKEKTVFANWVYTSPGETSTVTYKYLLPFRLDLDSKQKPADTYSLLVQKQAGDENSTLDLELTGLNDFEYIYKYPETLITTDSGWHNRQSLDTDGFYALIIKKR